MGTVIKITIGLFILSLIVNRSPLLWLLVPYIGYRVYQDFIIPRQHTKMLQQKAEEKLKLIETIRPEISGYLKAFTSAWETWPTKITLTSYDYGSIRNLIEQEKNIDLGIFPDPEFKKIVDEQLFYSGYLLFAHNFAPIVGDFSDKKPEELKAIMIRTYYETFGLNKTYLPFFIQYVDRNAVSVTTEEVTEELHKINQNIAIAKRTEAIKASILTHTPIVSNINIQDIDKLQGIDFEQVLGRLFQEMGYEVTVTKASGDQGADLLISKAGERKVVQAKRYNHPVSNSAVQEAVAAKAFYKYPQATVITNNYFTDGAVQLAEANGVELINRDQLKEWLHIYPIPK